MHSIVQAFFFFVVVHIRTFELNLFSKMWTPHTVISPAVINIRVGSCISRSVRNFQLTGRLLTPKCSLFIDSHGLLYYTMVFALRISRNLHSNVFSPFQTIRQEKRITVMLIAVVIVFLICNLPTAVVLIYTSVHIPTSRRESALLRGFGNIFNLLAAINAACNFMLYTALSDKYRKYFCAFFVCFRSGEPRQRNIAPMTVDRNYSYEIHTMNSSLR